MTDSILDSVKAQCMVDSTYTVFDPQFLLYVNSVFTDLSQLGIGPDGGFSIADNTTTWDAYIGTDDNLNNVKTYMGLKVRMLFDPPSLSFVIEAMNKQIQELEWRINVKREGESWTDPFPTTSAQSDNPCW